MIPMSIVVHLFDSDESRAEGWAKRLLSCDDDCEIYSNYCEQELGFWKLEVNGAEVTYTKATARGHPALFLVHGNDISDFESTYTCGPAQVTIWYGGFPGGWEDYPALKKSGVARLKIFRALESGEISLSDLEIQEILNFAQGTCEAEQVGCLRPPVSCSLLAALAVCIQSELWRKKDALNEWYVRSQIAQVTVRESTEDLIEAFGRLEALLPDAMKLPALISSGATGSLKSLQAEVRGVCDALGIDEDHRRHFWRSIETVVSSGVSGLDPALEDLIEAYEQLCWLEQQEDRE